MNPDTLRLAFDVMQFLLTGGIGIYVYISNKNRVTNDRITTITKTFEDQMIDKERRLCKVEEHVKHVPGHEDVTKLTGTIERIGGDVRVVKAEVEGIRELIRANTRTMDLVHQFLLNLNK